jgi:hypothetical protein
MEEWITRFSSDLVGRLTGPMTFRLILQPTMSMFYAIRDGLKDASAGRPPYLWTLLTRPGERMRLMKEGWHAVLRIILLGVGIDAIYQIIEFRHIYLGELAIVVACLAFLPYVLLRGPTNRLARGAHPRPKGAITR